LAAHTVVEGQDTRLLASDRTGNGGRENILTSNRKADFWKQQGVSLTGQEAVTLGVRGCVSFTVGLF
jgi:hypothetical protein